MVGNLNRASTSRAFPREGIPVGIQSLAYRYSFMLLRNADLADR